MWDRAGDIDRLQAEGLINGIRQVRGIIVLAHLAQGVGEVFGLDPSVGLRGLGRRSRARYADGLAREGGRVSREEGRTALTCRCGLIRLKARRYFGGDPGEEMRYFRRHCPTQVSGDATHLATTAFVEDRNPGLESGAMLGESRPRHCAGEDEMCGFGQAGEGLGPGRGIWRETRTRDGDQPPTRGQPGKRRAQMPGRRLGRPTIDVGHGREWRVHQDDAWAHARVEMIVNLCSVKASDRAAREQQSQKVDAGVCQLVQCKAAARDLNQDRQKAGPSRRLEDQVTGSDLRSREGHEPHGQRRRELLESLHLLRAPGVRGQEARHLGEDGQQRCRRASPSQQRTAEFPQEEDKCHLARFIGQFPIPSAHRIGVAEGTLHLEAQAQRVDLESLRQIGLQGLGHGKDPGRRIRQDRNNDRRQHGRDQRLEGHQNTSGWGKR